MKTVAQLLKLKAEQNHEVHTIAPHQMVLEALMVMAAKNVGALPVLKAVSYTHLTLPTKA